MSLDFLISDVATCWISNDSLITRNDDIERRYYHYFACNAITLLLSEGERESERFKCSSIIHFQAIFCHENANAREAEITVNFWIINCKLNCDTIKILCVFKLNVMRWKCRGFWIDFCFNSWQNSTVNLWGIPATICCYVVFMGSCLLSFLCTLSSSQMCN